MQYTVPFDSANEALKATTKRVLSHTGARLPRARYHNIQDRGDQTDFLYQGE